MKTGQGWVSLQQRKPNKIVDTIGTNGLNNLLTMFLGNVAQIVEQLVLKIDHPNNIVQHTFPDTTSLQLTYTVLVNHTHEHIYTHSHCSAP